MKYSKQEKAEARENMKQYMKEGMTIYTVLRSVSRSGMSRDISVVLLLDDGRNAIKPSWYVGAILDIPFSQKSGFNALRVSGCGMDMGYHVASSLAAAFGLKEWHHEWI